MLDQTGIKVSPLYITQVKRKHGRIESEQIDEILGGRFKNIWKNKTQKGAWMVKDNKDNINIMGSEIIIYQTGDGQTRIDVKFKDETVWLTQAQLGELYQTSKSNIDRKSVV